ncbi:neural/ectodermal development factor IMP-L2 isoform X2 [Nasonia vitripennis]|uniref:Ig-like domain-containing protein n=1 Tax=Nasonia vitripennis TaxID=7425 RepID=A0A7M7QJK4_NASVI|nr:neural/ectodermal development factor IMP-L2 isoform X2 [Nasonia vitripennis]
MMQRLVSSGAASSSAGSGAGAATGSYNSLALVLLSLASVISSGSSFSFSRNLHDVEQDVAEDASLYSQEMRLSAPEITQQKQSQQQQQLERYVSIRSSPSSYISVPAGHRLELKCEVDGSPPPKVYWIKGENPERQVEQLERESVGELSYTAISRELSKLVIDCVTPQDQGLVHCVGLSGDKMVISQPTVLNVQGGNVSLSSRPECQKGGASAPPVITRHRPIYFSEMGSTVELPCEASGKPRPHVYWLDGEGNPLMDPRFAVQPDGNLLISNIRWQDMDGYKCIAKSPLGETEAVTFLYPAAKNISTIAVRLG